MSDSIRIAALILCATPLCAQKDELPYNDPSTDPYTGGEPERMAAAGIVSLGGFEIAATDTKGIEDLVPYVEIFWVESEHFELGFGLGPYKVPQKERKQIRAELTELQALYPDINPKAKTLDPWLRAHMFIQRAERQYDEMLGLLGRTEDEFPDGQTPWDTTGEYLGEGPFLGQKGKYEILLMPSKAAHATIMREQLGLTTDRPQRWNMIERDSIIILLYPEDTADKKDPAMHGTLAFNLAHNLLDGYKHYNYETPRWLHEGLAHWFERRITVATQTFDASEGGTFERTSKTKWTREVQELVRKKEAPRLAELISLRNYAEFDLDDHVVSWSMVSFMIEKHPEGFANFLNALKTLHDENFMPDGSNMKDHHRDAIQACFGMTYPEFDQAWRDWVMGVEPEAEDDALPGGPGLGSGD